MLTTKSWMVVLGVLAAVELAGCAKRDVAGSKSPDTASPTSIDTSSDEAFTAGLLGRFQAMDPGGAWVRKELLTLTNGTELTVNLDRILGTCREAPESCSSEVDHFVQVAVDIAHNPGGAEATAANLVPVLRASSYLQQIPEAHRASMINEPFAGDLRIYYMVDEPNAVRAAKESDLTALELRREQLPALGLANLARVLPAIDAPSCAGEPVQVWAMGNFFESSRLLQREPWASLASQANGNLVVAAPETNALIVACNPNPEMLAKLTGVAHGLWENGAHPLTPSLFKWSPSGWQALQSQ